MDQNWTMDFIYNGPVQNRVSCHLGFLSTRAECNLVGDQPLFYIDDSADSDDLSFLEDMFDNGSEEQLIETLRARIAAYDRTSKSLEVINHRSTSDYFDRIFATDTITPAKEITSVLDMATKSRTFAAYHKILTHAGVKFVTDNTVSCGCYDRPAKIIRLNAFLTIEDAIVALTKAMRLAWHHLQGALMNPLRFQPEDAVVIHRLMAADQDVSAIAVAWELRLAGEKSVWNALMQGCDYDLCAAYALEAMTNFRSIANGYASRMTFEKWFVSGRCKSLDRTIIQVMLGNNTDYIFDDADISRMIATDIVAKMGERPLGKNYLSPIVTQIMVDGLYTEIRDRANANFLWFITFERKMAETEQELQNSGKHNFSADRRNNQDKPHDHNAEIIAFPAQTIRRRNGKRMQNACASVYYIDHFRAI